METASSHNAPRTGSIELYERGGVAELVDKVIRGKNKDYDALVKTIGELSALVESLETELVLERQKRMEAEQKLFFIHGGAKDIQSML